MKHIFVSVLAFVFLCSPAILHAAMSGGNFEIYADTISVGGGGNSSGTSGIPGLPSYDLEGSFGESFAQSSATGGTYTLKAGYQAAEKGILSLSLSTTTVSIGTISFGVLSTANITATVSTDTKTGYTLAISQIDELKRADPSTTDANNIDAVTDGLVSADAEEYGIRLTGDDRIFADDRSIPTAGLVAPRDIATRVGTVNAQATTIQFRAAPAQKTIAGNYSQTVTFQLTVNP